MSNFIFEKIVIKIAIDFGAIKVVGRYRKVSREEEVLPSGGGRLGICTRLC